MNLSTAAFCISVLAIVWSIYRMHRKRGNDFNLIDLLMENGRISRIGSVLMGAFFVSSWIVVDLQVKGKMSEGYFTLYIGGWVTPLIAKLLMGEKTAPGKKTK